MLTLPPDTIDDLIYDARAGDLPSLRETLTSLSQQHACSVSDLVAVAIDVAPEEEGGTGCCLLHYPAANGNLEILTYLLQTFDDLTKSKIINHKNHSGNTPLHWAALNTHLECVKVLVDAGADITLTNDAGLDAVFLAERADWSGQEVKDGNKNDNDNENTASGTEAEADVEMETAAEQAPPSKGRQVVEWLLASEKGGELESGVGGQEEDEK
ncbi:ankyrin repeat domain-containing protein [Aspergillus tanneri]|uniref:protein S-acyltransferase n=1 Tax=Aspergillus tanneri TaxID=1220188 RepID=A0A5M9MJ20_9EURO|nr:uncharacterized protein ATNIH1004_005684 [Aspergillus tanneri]KAA8647001.1 hypothetical protein ATNIH1004_005684 [Aspergillus tanneri]